MLRREELEAVGSGHPSEMRKQKGVTTHAGDRHKPQKQKGYRIKIGGMMR
jgi:hypothetical protein